MICLTAATELLRAAISLHRFAAFRSIAAGASPYWRFDLATCLPFLAKLIWHQAEYHGFIALHKARISIRDHAALRRSAASSGTSKIQVDGNVLTVKKVAALRAWDREGIDRSISSRLYYRRSRRCDGSASAACSHFLMPARGVAEVWR